MDATIKSIVSVSHAFASEVNIKRDFGNDEVNREKLKGYVPTSAARKALLSFLDGAHPSSQQRVHLVTGSYGTGKSHFGLLLANLMSRETEDPELGPFLDKLAAKDSAGLAKVLAVRKGAKPYLAVVADPHWDPGGFHHAIEMALAEALLREGIAYRPPSHFKAALECIENWRVNSSEAYKKLSDYLLSRQQTTEMLTSGLDDYNDNAYGLFEDAHKAVAFDADFYAFGKTKPSQIFEETAKHLRGTGDWQGIFLICDEYGAYLTQMAKDPESKDGQQLQEFAEFCKRSGENQCHLVVIAHQTMRDYAEGYRTAEEWAKIYGRFAESEYALTAAGGEHETEEMIESVILQKPGDAWRDLSSHADFGILADIIKDSDLYASRDMSWIESSLVKGCYPLHPFTTFCLPWLADRVGQRERTVFTFVSGNADGSLRDFIANTDLKRSDGRLNLYTLDRLFGFFREEIRKHSDYRPVSVAADNALAVCGESHLAQRIVKAISVLSVVGHPLLQPTKGLLYEALHLAPSEKVNAEEVLGLLVEQRVLYHRPATDRYELPGRAGAADARDAVKREKRALLQGGGFDLVGFLRRNYARQPVVAHEYADNHFVQRKAVCEYVSASHLANPLEYKKRIDNWYSPGRGQYQGDALILYVVADADTDVENARIHLAGKTCHHPQLVIASPKNPLTFAETALELQAISSLKQKGLKVEEGEISDEDIAALEEEAIHQMKVGLDDYLRADNLTWHCNGNVVANLPADGEEAYVSSLFEDVFCKTPTVKDEAIVNPAYASKEKAGRQQAIETLLGVEGPFQIQKSGGSPGDRILRTCLRDTELLATVAEKGSTAEFEVRDAVPLRSELSEVWSLLKSEAVAKQPETTTVMTKLVQPLLLPPYGLSTQLIQVVLAAFLRTRRNDMAVFSNLRAAERTGNRGVLDPAPLRATTIFKIVEDPQDYAIVCYAITPEERDYLVNILKVLGGDGSTPSGQGLWEDAKTALLNWHRELPALTRAAQSFEDPSCLRFLELLSDSSRNGVAKDLIQEHLPEALGVASAQHIQFIPQLQKVCTELSTFVSQSETRLLAQLGQVFSAKGSTDAEITEAIRTWYSDTLTDAQRVRRASGDEGALLQAVRQNAPLVEQMLVTLPEALGLGGLSDWESESTADMYMARVEAAKESIEAFSPGSAGTPSPDDSDSRASALERRIRHLFDELDIPASTRRDVLQRLLDEVVGGD